jgi:flagellum-specific ATP synthase
MPTSRVDPSWRYRAGFSAEVDQAISLHRPLEEFLAQGKEEATSLGQGYQRLEQILGGVDTKS